MSPVSGLEKPDGAASVPKFSLGSPDVDLYQIQQLTEDLGKQKEHADHLKKEVREKEVWAGSTSRTGIS